MRKIPFFVSFSLILVSALFLQNIFAQDPTQLGLPKAARGRLGKGQISGNIAFSADGTRLAVSSSIGIWMYNADTGAEIALLAGHKAPVSSVAYSFNGTTLVSGSNEDNSIRLLDARNGELKKTIKDKKTHQWHNKNAMAISPDGTTLAYGAYKEIHLWDVHIGQYKKTLQGHTKDVTALAFSPDGRTLASGGDRTIRLWNVQTGEHKKTIQGIYLRSVPWRFPLMAIRLLAEETERFGCGMPKLRNTCGR